MLIWHLTIPLPFPAFPFFHFVTLGNFGVCLLKFVQAPEQLPDYIGFVVQVSQNLKCGGIDVVKGESISALNVVHVRYNCACTNLVALTLIRMYV